MKLFTIFLTTIFTICGLWCVFFYIQYRPWNSRFNAEALLESYTQEEIDHFASFAFQKERLIKWQDDIHIGMEFESGMDSSVYKTTEKCIETLQPLLEEITININQPNYNVQVKTLDTNRNVSAYGITYHTFNPVAIPYPTIERGEIIISRNQGNNSIHSRLHFELSHILGFSQNLDVFRNSNFTFFSWFNPPTAMLPDSTEVFVEHLTDYSDLDKAAIRIMYDKEVAIDPGLTKEKFFRMIEEAKREMAQ